MGARIRSAAIVGIEGLEVVVEVDVCRGLPAYHLVGLPNAAVRESRQRVLAAVRNSGHSLPLGKVTINLRPADVRKQGTACDVAIALGLVAAGNRLAGGRDAVFLGELTLFGEVRPVRGLLAMVLDAAARGVRTVVVPAAQAWEARLVGEVRVVPAATLGEALTWWRGGEVPRSGGSGGRRDGRRDGRVAGDQTGAVGTDADPAARALWQGLCGQADAVRAALVAAAGRHNLLLVGPPGTGKTRLARAVGGLQPRLVGAEVLEVGRIHGVAGAGIRPQGLHRRPFRAPHHTVTRAGLIGGGTRLLPGEVTLAHRGILFLDELGEFPAAVLDVLRQPLEEKAVALTRAAGRCRFPADFQLLAAMNPCRCGYRGSRRRRCRCTMAALARYGARLSGPLLDRFDLFVELAEPRQAVLSATAAADPRDWDRLRARIAAVRGRWAELDSGATGAGTPGQIVRALGLDESACETLERARSALGVSVRGLLRCARVARTVAWLAGSEKAESPHVAEALGYRREALPVWSGPET